jgi:hypothetical protein
MVNGSGDGFRLLPERGFLAGQKARRILRKNALCPLTLPIATPYTIGPCRSASVSKAAGTDEEIRNAQECPGYFLDRSDSVTG